MSQIHQPRLPATLAILVVGPAVLSTLRRASCKASYGVEGTFDDMVGR